MSATLKVLNAKTEIANYIVANGETLIIKAQDEVNYRLVDNLTGLGPQNIIAKRVGNDLQILLENGDTVPDIIIEDYYDNDDPAATTNLVVGQHENGNIYAYVPESGQTADAVSMLAERMAAPQALGGSEISSLWVFSPWWLLALVPLAAVAIAAGGGGKGGSETDTTAPDAPVIDAKADGSVIITPATDAASATVTYTDESGKNQTIDIQKGDDGKWTSKGELPDGVTVNPDTGVVTIPDEAIKGGTDVTASNSDKAGNTSDTTTATSVDTDAPNPPVIDAKDDGSVTVMPANDATKTEITYVDEDGNTQTVTVEKGDDGKWTPSEGTTLPDGVTVDPTTGVVTIPDEAIKGGSEVTASNSDKAGNTSDTTTATSVDTDAPNPPVVDAKDDGSVTVTPADDATKTEITYVDEDGNTQTVIVEKGNDGKWTPSEGTTLPDGVTVDPTTGVVAIPDEAIKGGSEVTASNSDKADNESEPANETAVDTDAPNPPTIVANPDGSVTVISADDATETEVTYTDEDGNIQTVVVVKDPDSGTWTPKEGTTLPDGVTVDPTTGVITIPEDAIKGGTEVTATNSDEAGNESEPASETAVDTDAPNPPTIVCNSPISCNISKPVLL